MNAAICDRCDKAVRSYAGLTLYPVMPAGAPRGGLYEHSKDLCAECYAELLVFLKITTVKEEHRK